MALLMQIFRLEHTADLFIKNCQLDSIFSNLIGHVGVSFLLPLASLFMYLAKADLGASGRLDSTRCKSSLSVWMR